MSKVKSTCFCAVRTYCRVHEFKGCVWIMSNRVFKAWIDAIDRDVLSRKRDVTVQEWVNHIAPVVTRVRRANAQSS